MDKTLFIRLKQPISETSVRQKRLRFFGKYLKHLNFLNFAKRKKAERFMTLIGSNLYYFVLF